ncbi:hypothetical protein A3K69_08785 [Candidatus Bathyarchaeota archaeon RBG_16_57_9]|nr:MAG: hypothetical protein A3K69_08785 [Candidatus Bathyarchaeota archaeon RBG_16_57_9]
MQLGMPPVGNRQTFSYIRPVKKADFRLVIKTISAFIMLTFVAQLALSLGTLFYGVNLVVPDILDTWSGFTLFIVVPVLVELFTISGYVLLAYYMFLVFAIFLSCVWILLTSLRRFKDELTMKAKSREHSALFDTIGLLFATVFFSAVIGLIVNPSPEDMPSTDSVSEMLFLLANASVWEEIIVRVLFIGLPLVFVDLVRRTRQKHWYSYAIGGGMSFGIPETILIVLSALIFGVGHFTGGWGAWKILPATVGGIAFGYLFVKFGIAASIMMHFGTDYLSMPSEVTGSTALLVLTGLGILIWLGVGAGFFVYYTTRILEFLTGKRYFGPRPEPYPQPWGYPPLYMPVQSQYPPPQIHPMIPQPIPATMEYHPMPYNQPVQSWFTDGYVCPACGHTQARWVNGRFQCMRCGRLS